PHGLKQGCRVRRQRSHRDWVIVCDSVDVREKKRARYDGTSRSQVTGDSLLPSDRLARGEEGVVGRGLLKASQALYRTRKQNVSRRRTRVVANLAGYAFGWPCLEAGSASGRAKLRLS